MTFACMYMCTIHYTLYVQYKVYNTLITLVHMSRYAVQIALYSDRTRSDAYGYMCRYCVRSHANQNQGTYIIRM